MKLFQFQGDRKSFIYDLLVSWDAVLHDLESIMGTWDDVDIPYNKGERANVGILATAATRIGCVPFEEYFAEKGRGKSRRKGRADLWLARKNGTESYDFEAKYVKPSFYSKRLVWCRCVRVCVCQKCGRGS